MRNLWNDQDLPDNAGYLEERVYSSRLLGKNPDLVLHGGGNTSVKGEWINIYGDREQALFVKGSGSDLATIELKDFVPVRLEAMLKLSQLDVLSDIDMARELRLATLDLNSPAPSVETILHALIPYKFVDHTHADVILAITNTALGNVYLREIYGDDIIVLPYVMAGFDLAKLCAKAFALQSTSRTIGIVLMNHGIFSFGDTAKQSYDRMIDLVGRAEDFLIKNAPIFLSKRAASLPNWNEIPELRRSISRAAGFPMLLKTNRSEIAMSFLTNSKILDISQRGPVTPDHIIRTKRIPMFGRDVDEYVKNYRNYFNKFAQLSSATLTMLDPAPRVVLDPEIGLMVSGRSARDVGIVEDIYLHTQNVILRAEALGGYEALSEQELFSMEYWDLEQAKLKKAGNPKLFAGEVALVTGAASGIGKACVQTLLSRGAAVVGVDINADVQILYEGRPEYLGITADLTSDKSVKELTQKIICQFGGLDMLVLNAGIFPGGKRIDMLLSEEWRKVMTINLDSNVSIMREAYPLLKLAPRYGRVVVVGSKNVAAPGPGAAAYSASKAAMTQLARVAALEWGKDAIRINLVHPNAVFDTGIWTEEVLEQRAAHYGLTVNEYKRNNILGEEISSKDVAELIAEICGPVFAKITGAQIPIDGGNERVI
jgi:rhamnose utilization protein RhaD (predicted bifunctional aldolase and dehydrogenase)/NAD(P)-dependent dehydrogenase (short-subunit alcohol dehydrogenase family)